MLYLAQLPTKRGSIVIEKSFEGRNNDNRYDLSSRCISNHLSNINTHLIFLSSSISIWQPVQISSIKRANS